jgi:dTDP-4-dehydrorhamnose reductase
MRAIRRVNPSARLVQTDDLGKTFSTPPLAYQAEHENQRRWLAFDLLCGRVDARHPWWRILRDHGIPARHLDVFRDGEGAPDIIGINHYLTSERFLDQRLERYPPWLHGGNGRHAYADVEAVRMPLPPEDLGPAARLREAWQRYSRPLAVTEVHHGCTRDEQVRWLAEVWSAARQVRAEGADIRAVTLWSLFGSVDWNTLLTREHGIYEPGAFDIRGPAPRPTALAHAAADLARRGRFDHPVLDQPGWWRREARFYRPLRRRSPLAPSSARPLLAIGLSPALGRPLARLCAARGLDCVALQHPRRGGVAAELRRQRPWAVLAGAQAEEPAAACAALGLPLVAFSSAQVFDGRAGRPYGEDDPAAPAGACDPGLARAEAGIARLHPGALIVRTGPLFDPHDPDDPLFAMLQRLASRLPVEEGADMVSPTYAPDLVHVALDLLIDGAEGLWHLANPGAVSRLDWARDAARRAGLDPASVRQAMGQIPLCHALTTRRGALLPPLPSALDRFFHEATPDWIRPRSVFGIAAE